MASLVTVRISTTGLEALVHPAMIQRATTEIINRGVEILTPIAREETPTRTGRGRTSVIGSVEFKGAHLIGRIHAGKAFYLNILATGAKAHEIMPRRFKTTRRGALSLKARRANRALGPTRATGALDTLRFKGRGGGGYIFRRGPLFHPGIRSDNFFERAARRGEPPVGAAAEAIVQAALDRATHA